MRRSAAFKKMTLIDKDELSRLREKQIRDYNPHLRALSDIKLAMDDVLKNVKLNPYDRSQLINLLNRRFLTIYKGLKYDGLLSAPSPAPIEMTHTAPPVEGGVHTDTVPALVPAAAPQEQVPAVEPVPLFGEHGAAVPGNLAEIDPDMPPLEELPGDILADIPPAHAEIEAAAPVAQLAHDVARRSMQTAPLLKFPNAKDLRVTRYKKKYEELTDMISQNPHVINRGPGGELILSGRVIHGTSLDDLVRSLFIRSKSMNMQGDRQFLKSLHELNINPELISNATSKSILNSIKNPDLTLKSESEPEESGEDTEEEVYEEAIEGNGKRVRKGLKRSKTFSHPLNPFKNLKPPPGKRPKILRVYR